ncbi:Arm DNA-binding domain-containing protein [Acinetobacter colistiniresistens]|uniref:DUF4102 domain-containing protein n=1 Tax=Acinetobacter colistiniresistens TaxID=280145 RepID=S3T6A4_9GAMM|nr:Arm DNA-binding domain-containing protein [Acinetobacter colistiniresistens]EPG37061.1 hypothetical protein F907_02326 [Acinetobacter colistiniresistens]TVT78626.1 DUF4102 domain-containing protein [Acinetobacter colistiniresistens]
MKLTDIECRKAQSKEKRYRLSDENGLSLLVTPSGQKYWNIRFTVLGERKSEHHQQPNDLTHVQDIQKGLQQLVQALN